MTKAEARIMKCAADRLWDIKDALMNVRGLCREAMDVADNAVAVLTVALETKRDDNPVIDRYEIVGETVRDPVTGLEWQRTPAGPMMWFKAVAYAASLGDGWRLPTVAEQIAMINYERSAPATDFPGESGCWYWSAEDVAGSASGAWHVDFYYGNVNSNDKTNTNFVRCARSGRGWSRRSANG